MSTDFNKKAKKLVFFDDKPPLYDGKPLFPFSYRTYQIRDYKRFRSMEQPLFFLMYARRSGKDAFCWSVCVSEALRVPGNYVYVLPNYKQAKRVIWNGGMIDKKTKLFTRYYNLIPKDFIIGANAQELTISLSNGSIINLVGTLDPETARGTNATGFVFSEFAFYKTIEAYQVIQPIVTEAKSWILINTTPNGFNFSWRLFNELKYNNRWYTNKETVETLVDESGNRYITEQDITEYVENGGCSPGQVRQEFYCEPVLNEDELYYGEELTEMRKSGRIRENTLIAGLPMHFVFDLGNDATPIIGFQLDLSGTPVISYYFKPIKSVKPWNFYWNEINTYVNKNNLSRGKFVLPHDSANRSRSVSAVSSAALDFRNLGADVIVLKRKSEKDALISLSKVYLPKTIINNSCEHLIDALSSYNRKYDEKNDIFSDKPTHDWASHPSDAYQYLCQAIYEGLAKPRNRISYRT